MLRRPFSIGGLQQTNDGALLNVLGHVIGPGTRWLSQLKIGDTVDIIGPLGSSFSLPTNDCKAILIAGGIGLPPVRWFGERLANESRPAWVPHLGVSHRLGRVNGDLCGLSMTLSGSVAPTLETRIYKTDNRV